MPPARAERATMSCHPVVQVSSDCAGIDMTSAAVSSEQFSAETDLMQIRTMATKRSIVCRPVRSRAALRSPPPSAFLRLALIRLRLVPHVRELVLRKLLLVFQHARMLFALFPLLGRFWLLRLFARHRFSSQGHGRPFGNVAG